MAIRYNPYTAKLEIGGPPSGGGGSLMPGAKNLGISLSSGVFSLTAEDGSDLSSSNPAYIVMPSSSSGETQQFQITSNQSFEDANGTSDITGNLFGLTSGVSETNDVPFFIYAVSDSTDSTISFGISRIPNINTTTSSGNLGSPSSATADIQQSIFFFDSVTLANYSSRPCLCIGSFRMTKDSSNDWTVSSLAITDGIGTFQEDKKFTISEGQYGNDSGSYFVAGSTILTFTTNTIEYSITKNGICDINYIFDDRVTSAGASPLKTYPPFITNENSICGMLVIYDDSLGVYSTGTCMIGEGMSTNRYLQFIDEDIRNSLYIKPNDIGLHDNMYFNISYNISNS